MATVIRSAEQDVLGSKACNMHSLLMGTKYCSIEKQWKVLNTHLWSCCQETLGTTKSSKIYVAQMVWLSG